MSVTFPRGFRAAGVTAGMKPSGQPDLGLLVADEPCAATGLFTTNAFAAHPVRISRERLADGTAGAVLVNSGQANAGTGPEGEADALRATEAVARLLGIEPDAVLCCSTGVIGERIHLEELTAALPALVRTLAPEGGEAFARAIMTTDTVHKQAAAERSGYRVGGCAKGVGMVAPNLATMLAFVTTDAPVPPGALPELARATLAEPFGALTVDGCSSTNDTVLLLASGAAGSDPVVPGTRPWAALAEAVSEVAESLVTQLARDAEGATHVLRISVEGAEDDEQARAVARAIAESPLVKAAAWGGDPNPGRVLQAVGSSGARFDPTAVRAWWGETLLVEAGRVVPAYFDPASGLREAARAAMAEPEIRLRVELGAGPGRGRAIGCDLTCEYVRINGEYTT